MDGFIIQIYQTIKGISEDKQLGNVILELLETLQLTE